MTKIKKYSYLSFMFLCPIIFNNTNLFDLRTFQERAFQLLSMCLISLFVGNAWISAFMILNVFSLMYNDFAVGLPQVLNVFLGCILFMVSRAYFKKNDFLPYAKILLWVFVLNLFWMVMQSSGIDPLYIAQDAGGVPQPNVTFRDFSGLFGIKMANGIFISFILPILAVVNIWLAPLLVLPLFFCRSSIVALSVFATMSFYLYYTSKKVFVYFLVIGMLGGITYVYLDLKDDSKTFMSRFPVWHSALKYTLMRPLGWGPDSYRSYTKQKDFLFYSDYDYNHALLKKLDGNKALFSYYEMDNGKMSAKNKETIKNNTLSWWDNPHNEYIQMMFEYGFLGLVILGGFMREMYYRFKFSSKSNEIVMIASCLLVFFVSGLGHFPMHLARLACLFPIFLGGFYAKSELSNA